jgi:hypothetical protein
MTMARKFQVCTAIFIAWVALVTCSVEFARPEARFGIWNGAVLLGTLAALVGTVALAKGLEWAPNALSGILLLYMGAKVLKSALFLFHYFGRLNAAPNLEEASTLLVPIMLLMIPCAVALWLLGKCQAKG